MSNRMNLGSCNSSQGSLPKKKLVIKPFKEKPKLPENYEHLAWEKLQLAIDAIAAREAVQVGREELYQYVENLCLHKYAPKLYHRLGEECERHIGKSLDGLQENMVSNEVFLNQLESLWFHHIDMATTIRSVFLVLDRTYVVQTPGVYPIMDLCSQYLKKEFLKRRELLSKMSLTLLDYCTKERNGEQVQKSMIKNVLRMLTSLNLYEDAFGLPYINASRLFFKEEGERKIEENDAALFLKHCEFRLLQVSEQVESYLDARTKRPLVRVVEEMLLLPHVSVLLTNQIRGFDRLMDENRFDDLKLMFSLFSRLGLEVMTQLKSRFMLYCKTCGSSLVNDETRDKVVVKELLDMKLKYDTILKQSFESNEGFKNALKEALELAVNCRNNSKLAELMAKYADVKLRGEKGVTEEEAERELDKLMVVFRLLNTKDVFEAFYKKDLAKRLLLNKSPKNKSGSASYELEQAMINKLKLECGNVFTSKLEGMFKDLDLSTDLMSYFTEYLSSTTSSSSSKASSTGDMMDSLLQDEGVAGGQLGSSSEMVVSKSRMLDLSVKVLTMGYWPTYPPMPSVKLNTPLQQAHDRFMHFYDSKYQGRRLVWQHSLGQCIVKVNFEFKQKKHELEVTTFQTLVLSCFNIPYNDELVKEKKEPQESSSSSSSSASVENYSSASTPRDMNDQANDMDMTDEPPSSSSSSSSSSAVVTKTLPSVKLSFAQLQSVTGIETSELKRTLQSLACGKIRVLVKQPKSKEVSEEDNFYFNSHFSNQKLFRIKISSIQMKETSDENSKIHADVGRDRAYAIDAAIVRIMKARKTLPHSHLISEVFGQLPFPTTGPDVKKRLESLIEREYVERDENSANTYNYLA